MEQQTSSENWQVEVGGQLYHASFAELGEWIGEGALQPEDKVRKGNLRWIEARKVPGLLPFFNARARGETIPATITSTDAAGLNSALVLDEPIQLNIAEPTVLDADEVVIQASVFEPDLVKGIIVDPKVCAIHPGFESAFICETCSNGFCKACPNSYGGTVKLCPLCGALCKPAGAVQEQKSRDQTFSQAIGEGFGINDFVKAVAFPLKFKTSLFFGAVMYAAFSLAQSASGIGGMTMFASAIIAFMLANMMIFGVLSNTVENFSQGKLDANFMPSYDDFSAWDDIVQPFFLYVAVMIASFGPFILTLIIGTYLVVSSVSSQMNTFQSEVERLPGTQYYQGRETVEQSQQVKKVLSDTTSEHDERIGEYNQAASGNSNAVTTATPDEDLELYQMAQQNRRKELEAAFGKTQETKDAEFGELTSNLLKLAAPLVVIGAFAFLWGMFFFPAATAVASYTRSFSATVNPLVGLDTIKRLGVDYLKILLMGFVLVLVSGFSGMVLGMIFAPFNLPGMGNLVAKGFSSLITFYLAVVFACILGYALFKNSEKLQLLK
ncbi:MAG: DUF4013 domain-containing protein [Pyrinomonadaceae bacterium]